MKFLLDNGADIEQTNKRGQTALMLAARHGNVAVAYLLQVITIMGDTMPTPEGVDTSSWKFKVVRVINLRHMKSGETPHEFGS